MTVITQCDIFWDGWIGRNSDSLAGPQICIPYDQTGVIKALKGSSLVLRYNLHYILYGIYSKIIRKLDNFHDL